MHTKFDTKQPVPQQRGAALIVCLVLLLILTIVGTASVEDLSLQTNMARNSQFHMQAFNTVLSEVNGQVTNLRQDEALLTEALNSGTRSLSNGEMVMPGTGTNFEQSTSISYSGSTVGLEYSMDDFSNYQFEINSSASLPNTGTRSDQLQGLSFTGGSAN